MPFYEILLEANGGENRVLTDDLYARFMFILIQILITEYQNLLEINVTQTHQKCTNFLYNQFSTHVEKKFVLATNHGIQEFQDSLKALQKCVTIPLCNEFSNWDGQVCQQQTKRIILPLLHHW